MKHTEKEILDALKVIKGVCEDFRFCRDCPIYNDHAEWCGLRDEPDEWELNENGNVWRAFV